MGAYSTVKSSSANPLQESPQSEFDKAEITNMNEPSEEREEGEIVDEYEDIISSDEEFSMRQRIEELEAKNAELEKIANISGVYGSGTYDRNKQDACSYQDDRYPLISIDISDEEDYPSRQQLSRISRRRKSFQHSHLRHKMTHTTGSSHSRREKSSSPPPAPLFRPSDKLLLSMFHSRLTNHSHSNKRKRKNKKPHSMKSSRKSRDYYASDSDGDCKFDADDSCANFNGFDEDYPLNRDELRSALARNTHRKEQQVSLKDRLIRRKENTDILNEKIVEKSKEVVQEETKSELPAERSEPENNMEEQELRIIALKSAVIRKHLVRKKRNENVAYSPSDFDDICPKIAVSPSINNSEDVDEACNSMEISPVPSPTMILSDDEGMNTIPVDMDIANSDSDCALPSYEKWVPIEQIPLPSEKGGEMYVPTPVRFNGEQNGGRIPPELKFDSIPISPNCLDSEEEEEEIALRALLLAKMNSPKGQKVPKEEPRREEEVGTPDREISLEAEALRNFLINNMKKKAQRRQSPARVLKEAVRRLTARNEEQLIETSESKSAFQSCVKMEQKDLDEVTTEMAEFKLEGETKEVTIGGIKSQGKTEKSVNLEQDKEKTIIDPTEQTDSANQSAVFDCVEETQSQIEKERLDEKTELITTERNEQKEVVQEVEALENNVARSNDVVVKKEIELPYIPGDQKKVPKAEKDEVLASENGSKVIYKITKTSNITAKAVSKQQGSIEQIDDCAQESNSEAPKVKEENLNSENKLNSPLILNTLPATENEKCKSHPGLAEVPVNKKKVLVKKVVKNENESNSKSKPKGTQSSAAATPKKVVDNKTKMIKVKDPQATPLIPTNKMNVKDENKTVNNKPKVQAVPKIGPTPQTTPKILVQHHKVSITKIVKPNKVINQQNIDLKRKPIEKSTKSPVPVKKVKIEDVPSTNRLITAADMPQVKKLVIQLRASDTESDYSVMSADEYNDGENSSQGYLINRSITIENDFYDIASPISLPMESPYDTPTRSASPAVRVSTPQPIVGKSIVNDFFEAKLDQFLKNVRSKVSDSTIKVTEEQMVPAAASLNTPVAVRHLPQASQQEYRRLINRMKMLERQKQAKNIQVVVKTVDGAMEDDGGILKTDADGQTLAKKVLLKNSIKLPICDKTSVVAHKQKTTPEKKPSNSLSSVTSPQIAIPPKTKPVSPLKSSTANQLSLYENSYRKTGDSIILHLDKSIELVQVAKEAKMAKLKHEHRLRELRKEMEEVQKKLQDQQERITKVYPDICSSHRLIESLKTRRVKITKAVTNLGRSIIGASYCINNDQRQIISEKSKKLAAEIKLVNTMNLGDVETWKSHNLEKSSTDKPTVVIPPKDLFNLNIKTEPAVKNDNSIMQSLTKNVPANDTESPIASTQIDTSVPEVTVNLESNPNVTIVPETVPREEKQNASTTGHEEAIETQPSNDKQPSQTSGEGDVEKEPLLDGVILQDYVSPLLHLRDERQINPNGIVCPYQLKGQCDDKDCKYTHLEE